MDFILALLAFSFLIVGHEFGHFIMAKANGVKVEEFSLGMGPKLFGVKGKETEYIIKAFPIGGYVKMFGEEEESTDEKAFSSKSPARKLSIVAAGPIMNLIIAIFLFALIAGNKGYVIPVVSEVQSGAPAEAAGIQLGDEIIKVNNKDISTWEEFTNEVYMSNLNIEPSEVKPLEIIVKRDNQQKTISVTPIKNEAENRYMIGVAATVVSSPNVIQSIKYGVEQAQSIQKQLFSFFSNLFSGNVTFNDVGGPITIMKVSTKAAEAGIWNLVYLTAFLSMQLAIFNIIPFPALDGFWIFILIFEIITRKKLDDKKVAIVNYIGFSILMAVMAFVVLKDIFYPINLN